MSAPIHGFGPKTIRSRLWFGFGILVTLLVIAGVVARRSFTGISDTIVASLDEVQIESQLASALSGDVTKTIEAGSRYLETRDSAAQNAFRAYGWSAHAVQRRMNDLPGQSAGEVGIVAAIDNTMSAMEVDYALAHRLADLGRSADAARAATAARSSVDALLDNIDRLGKLKADKVAAARARLAAETSRRSEALIGLIALALALSLVVVLFTVRRIAQPLDILVRHSQRLSEGDLTSRAIGDMPGEFSLLASTMNQTGESLSRVVSVATLTAESVSSSAHDLASVTEQISLSASQMASAMTEVSHGADVQVKQLRAVDESLQVMREAADGVKQRSSEVTDLAHRIEGTAHEKRQEI
ncbi:MAG TPA: methyl-accepting chemotaxis protein, partial [Gemmatimonadaceae bacterium]|nr:methyl-accepting chemotaxis protein [Gemmatimonadaceae bacterium]